MPLATKVRRSKKRGTGANGGSVVMVRRCMGRPAQEETESRLGISLIRAQLMYCGSCHLDKTDWIVRPSHRERGTDTRRLILRGMQELARPALGHKGR